MKTLVLAIVAIPALFAAAPALAGDPRPAAVRVQTADLDLSTAQGRAKLDRRIAGATEAVCGSYATVGRDQDDRITACRRAVAARVKPQVSALTLANSDLAQR